MAEPSDSGLTRQRVIELYDALLATQPGVPRKGATMPYTSLNGNMFSLIGKDGVLALRLPAPDRAKFLERYDTQPTIQYGRQMKEYVDVPEHLLANTDELAQWFASSLDYARSLKPKPTKRPKK